MNKEIRIISKKFKNHFAHPFKALLIKKKQPKRARKMVKKILVHKKKLSRIYRIRQMKQMLNIKEN
jgi:hypothetical protein